VALFPVVQNVYYSLTLVLPGFICLLPGSERPSARTQGGVQLDWPSTDRVTSSFTPH
jgi:hypothetical protein